MHQIIQYVLLLISVSCTLIPENNSNPISRKTIYFDIDSLVQEQVKALLATNDSIRVNKFSLIDNKPDSAALYLDSTALENEMRLIRKATINKPNLNGAYQQTELDSSGYSIKRFVADDREKYNVNRIELIYTDTILAQLNITYLDTSRLYYSRRNMVVTFDSAGIINALGFKGSQKMITVSPTEYDYKLEFIK